MLCFIGYLWIRIVRRVWLEVDLLVRLLNVRSVWDAVCAAAAARSVILDCIEQREPACLCSYCIFSTFILYRFMPPSRPTAATVDEEVTPRPIIKEEDLSKMDDIAHDAGWATHDDIDYK